MPFLNLLLTEENVFQKSFFSSGDSIHNLFVRIDVLKESFSSAELDPHKNISFSSSVKIDRNGFSRRLTVILSYRNESASYIG